MPRNWLIDSQTSSNFCTSLLKLQELKWVLTILMSLTLIFTSTTWPHKLPIRLNQLYNTRTMAPLPKYWFKELYIIIKHNRSHTRITKLIYKQKYYNVSLVLKENIEESNLKLFTYMISAQLTQSLLKAFYLLVWLFWTIKVQNWSSHTFV